MSQFSINSIVEFIVEFFSELPPKIVASIAAVAFFALMVFCGFSTAFVISILMLFFTQFGIFFAGSYILCIAIFSIYGLIKGYQLYKKILLSYELPKANRQI